MQIKTAQDLHKFLIEKIGNEGIKEKIPKPEDQESIANYSKKLESIEGLNSYIVFQSEIKKAIPINEEDNKYLRGREHWVGREESLRELKKRIDSDQVLLVQNRDSNFFTNDFQNELKNDSTAGRIYKEIDDYSFAVTLGKIIDEVAVGAKCSSEGKEIIVSAMLNNILLLNSSATNFYEAVLHEISSNKEIKDKEELDDLTDTAKVMCLVYAMEGAEQIEKMDKELLSNNLSEKDQVLAGIDIKKESGFENENGGILITTSNGGGCHKNIANNTAKSVIEAGYDCAIINESEITQIDELQQVLGIPRSDLYPVIFQQCGSPDACNLMKDIDNSIRQKFTPPYEFAQLRKAVKQCEDKINVQTIYSTQHYAQDFRVLPHEAKMVFQVCDYGHMGKLEEIAKLVAVPTFEEEPIKFLIPSETCLKNVKKEHDERVKTKYESGVFEQTVYPTRILTPKETEQKFGEFVDEQGLFSADEKNVQRCAIVMGGQGCGELIEQFMDNIDQQIRSEGISKNEKIEIIVACGRNDKLKEGLEKKYKDLLEGSEFLKEKGLSNVKIKFLGYLDNEKLIAYNKNAVLITKPGGGTVAECVENNIQTLVHYDPNLPWERGNAEEIPKQGIGKIMSGQREVDGEVTPIHSLNILKEISGATEERQIRLEGERRIQAEYQKNVQSCITLLEDFLITVKQEKINKSIEESHVKPMEESQARKPGLFNLKDLDSKKEKKHLKETKEKLEKLLIESPKDRKTLVAIQQLINSNSDLGKEESRTTKLLQVVNEKLSPLLAPLDKKTSDQILTSKSKQKM